MTDNKTDGSEPPRFGGFKWQWRVLGRPLLYAVAGALFGASALLFVGATEALLESHREHVSSLAGLRTVNSGLRLDIDRMNDLENLSMTDDSLSSGTVPAQGSELPISEARVSASRYGLTSKERADYRRAAVAELYALQLESTSRIRRGNDLVVALGGAASWASRYHTSEYEKLCREWNLRPTAHRRVACPEVPGPTTPIERLWTRVNGPIDRALDSAVSSGTYTRTIYHVGSMSLIFLGFIGLAGSILAIVGAVTGLTLSMVHDFVVKVLGSAQPGINMLAAGAIGAGALVAGAGAASALADNSAAASSSGVSIHRHDVDSTEPGGGSGNDAKPDSRGSRSSRLGLVSWNFFRDADPDAEVVGRQLERLALALERISEAQSSRPTVVTDSTNVIRALESAGDTITGSIAASAERADVRMDELSSDVRQIGRTLGTVADEEREASRTMSELATRALVAIGEVSDATRLVNETATQLLPVARYTACQLEWQRSMSARNGLQRTVHMLGGYRHDPCASMAKETVPDTTSARP